MIKNLEKQIIGKMLSIKTGKSTLKDSGISVLLNKMKTLDEPLYDTLLERYKVVLKNYNDSKDSN